MSRSHFAKRRLCVAAACFALAGCGESRPLNVLMIVVDTLRADHLGCYGYERETSPAIDRLAAQAIRFDRAYATAPWTQASIASLLTGHYPSRHGVVKLKQSLPASTDTLAEILSAAGFNTGAVVSHFLIGPRFGFDQGFARFELARSQGWNAISTPEVVGRAESMLESFAEDGRPFFLFVHLFDPHARYQQQSSVDFATETVGRLTGTEHINALRQLDPPPNDLEVAFLRALYDEEIRFTDAGVDALLTSLADHGLEDETLVVFTADHGEEFFERGWIGHTRTLHEELVRVPLLVRMPDRWGAGIVTDRVVSLASLLATLVELVGVEPQLDGFQAPSFAALLGGDGSYSGQSAFVEVDFARRRPEPGKLDKHVRQRALIRGHHKLIEDQFTGELALYDLAKDPRERNDRSRADPDTTRSMREELEHTARDAAGNAEPDSAIPEFGEDRELLRDLGYAE